MRLFAAFALAAAALVPPGSSSNLLIGTWKLSSAQSTLDPANRLVITPVSKGVHLVMSGETHLDFTASSDGHGTPVAGNPAFNQIELHRMGKRASEVREMKDGALVATVRDALSKDGKELTITTTSPNRPEQVTVWIRGGVPVADKDPFAGEWTEDLGKTRLRQGLVLKIDPNGGDGIHFKGDYSFTGRFDGKPYDLQNSRNDTVQLSQLDSHTVEADSRRDNQVTQRDRWVTSADGRTLTLNSKATLETGQHLSEVMVFQRQP